MDATGSYNKNSALELVMHVDRVNIATTKSYDEDIDFYYRGKDGEEYYEDTYRYFTTVFNTEIVLKKEQYIRFELIYTIDQTGGYCSISVKPTPPKLSGLSILSLMEAVIFTRKRTDQATLLTQNDLINLVDGYPEKNIYRLCTYEYEGPANSINSPIQRSIGGEHNDHFDEVQLR